VPRKQKQHRQIEAHARAVWLALTTSAALAFAIACCASTVDGSSVADRAALTAKQRRLEGRGKLDEAAQSAETASGRADARESAAAFEPIIEAAMAMLQQTAGDASSSLRAVRVGGVQSERRRAQIAFRSSRAARLVSSQRARTMRPPIGRLRELAKMRTSVARSRASAGADEFARLALLPRFR